MYHICISLVGSDPECLEVGGGGGGFHPSPPTPHPQRSVGPGEEGLGLKPSSNLIILCITCVLNYACYDSYRHKK